MAVADPTTTAHLPQTLAVQTLTRGPTRRPQVETPQLSVVIVNYCQWRNTARLTQQLRRCEAIRRGAAEVLIVDNHSPVHPLARKLRRLSGVSVEFSGRNRGFATAVNRGTRHTRGEWILLLNPDVTVPDGFLDDVLDSAQRWPAIDPRAGVVGFQLRHRDGSRQASTGPFPTLFGTLSGLVLPRPRRKCRHKPLTGRQTVAWVTGGCLLVRRDCFERLRGMDRRFFLYYEDVDFCRRVREAGWSVWYDPGLRVTHHFPLHSRAVPPPLRLVTRYALLTYARKHWPRWQASTVSALVWLEATIRESQARWRGEAEAVGCFRHLRRLIVDLLWGRDRAARSRVRLVANTLDRIASEHDGRTR